MEQLDQELWQQVWTEFNDSVENSRGAFRTFTLATVSAGAPEARTLVIRRANESDRTLVFHTHQQSPKCRQLFQEPRAVLVSYAHAIRLQVRLSGTVEVQTDSELTQKQWDNANLSSRRTYYTVAPPSSFSPEPTSNFPPELERRALTLEESEHARYNFAILVFKTHTLEVLALRATGHRRVSWSAVDGWKPRWMAP